MNNPFYYAKVWKGQGDKLNGQILDIEEYLFLLKKGHILFSFTGRKATVCVLTENSLITRLQALDFATMFMRGTYVTISVDLKNLTSTTAAGTPPP
jgi:hypothetical protein